jgi:cobalamin biosynthesis Mg chelatase CobN
VSAARPRPALWAVVLTAALVTAGCAGRPDLDADRAATLQAAVLEVTTTAAAGQWDATDAALAETRDRLDAGVDAGEVSTSRYREIDRALDRVAAAVASERARVAAEQAAAAQAAADQAAAEQAAAEAAAAEQAAASSGPAGKPKPGPPASDKGPGKAKPKDKG